MIVVQDDLWLCTDCLMIAVNGDASGLDYSYSEKEAAQRLAAIEAGLDELGPHLVPDFDSEADEDNGIREFSSCGCDCCGSRLAGEFHRFAVLGESA
jgi:hypothetical protein